MQTLSPNERILRLKEVINRTGISRSLIYDYIRKNKFPKQVFITDRCIGFLSSDIDAWIAARAQKLNVAR